MREKEEFWNHLFEDKPVSQITLSNFQNKIMAQILSNPVNFDMEILLAKRRKLGFLLLGIILSLCLGSSLLIYFGVNVLQQLLGSALVYLTGLLVQIKLVWHVWSFVWNQFSWPLLGLGIVWVIIHGTRQDILSPRE